MKIRHVALCALLLSPGIAFAGHSSDGGGDSFLDLYYVPKTSLDISSSGSTVNSDGGKGLGFRVRAAVAPNFFLQGEYQKDSYDGFNGVSLDTDADFLRAGVGMIAGESGVYGIAEFIKEKFTIGAPINSDQSDNGYGLHLGLQGHPGTGTLYAELGYTDVGDFGNGLEFMLGGAVRFGESVGVFADYRQTKQEDDSGGSGKFGDFRVGVRFSFGQ